MKAPESHPISVSNHLLSSLLDGIPHVEAFKGKWSLIRAKITELQAQLTEFADFPEPSPPSPHLKNLLTPGVYIYEREILKRRLSSPCHPIFFKNLVFIKKLSLM
jgi:hypothetical protein